MSWHAPADAGELAGLLEELGGGEAPVLPTGAPAGASGDRADREPPAAVPPGGDLPADVAAEVVSTAAFDGVREHRPRDSTVTVGAGTRVSDLEAFLAREGGWLPVGGPARRASVGGLVAAGLAGPYDEAFGSVGRQLLACRVITHRGTEARWGRAVMKNVAGYDMPRLLTGSFGRLGVIHEATFRLWPTPGRRRALALSDGDDGLGLAAGFLEQGVDAAARPEAVVWRPGRLEVRLFGAEASVGAREERLRAWAEGEGAELREAAPGTAGPAFGAVPADEPGAVGGRKGEHGGGASPGGRRPLRESVVGLTVPRSRFVAVVRSARRALGDDLTAAEGYPPQGFLRVRYRRRDGEPSPLEALEQTCPEALLRMERGTGEELERTGARRDSGARALGRRVVDALEGRPRHWLSSYL